MSQQCHQGDPPEMRGQPGFTLGERKRFSHLLGTARLVDSYRRLHPATESPPAEGPHYTWRGSPPVNMPVARYHGKGMRIDYGLIAEELLPRLSESSILGHGAERRGFLGSDHCPIRLVLKDVSGCERDGGATDELSRQDTAAHVAKTMGQSPPIELD